jgi:hypothetical protein
MFLVEAEGTLGKSRIYGFEAQRKTSGHIRARGGKHDHWCYKKIEFNSF